MQIRRLLCSVAGFSLLAVTAAAQPCTPAWSDTFGNPGTDNDVFALEVLDADLGPRLYAGGLFKQIGGVSAERVAVWDGQTWAPLGDGFDRAARTLAVFDPGNGPRVFAGGNFTASGGVALNRVAKWTGQRWVRLDQGLESPLDFVDVHGMVVFDDGSGPALFIAGEFETAGRLETRNVAKWTGDEWEPLGQGLDGIAFAVTVFDDGNGEALYFGGDFDFPVGGNLELNGIVRWDGRNWSQVGGGFNRGVRTLQVFDDGNGEALYAGGSFNQAEGQEALRIARWTGSRWMKVGAGFEECTGQNCSTLVRDLEVFDDGNGPALYAAGSFTKSGPRLVNQVARWNGNEWTAVAGGTNDVVRALTVAQEGGREALYAGGLFTTAGGERSIGIARYGCGAFPCDQINKLKSKCKPKNNKHKFIAKVLSDLPMGTELNATLDGKKNRTRLIRNNGTTVFRWANLDPGSYEACLVECPQFCKRATCD